MKKVLSLSAITLLVIFALVSCKKDTHNCTIKWLVTPSNITGVQTAIEVEANSIYRSYDDYLSKANFGTVDKSAHKIEVEEVTNNKIEKIKADAKKYALKANDELANFHPQWATYTVTVTFEGEDGQEILATYSYKPEEK